MTDDVEEAGLAAGASDIACRGVRVGAGDERADVDDGDVGNAGAGIGHIDILQTSSAKVQRCGNGAQPGMPVATDPGQPVVTPQP